MALNTVRKILIITACLILSTLGLSRQSVANFAKCYPGKQIRYKNMAGDSKILTCTGKKNGVVDWQYTDGSSTLGEEFNPAKDCSDIVDNLPGARDGFYWFSFENKVKHKLWCDIHTNGGGFILVGMTNSLVTGPVPSLSTPVNPKGPTQWSSKLGDIRILDFGIQLSSDNAFGETKAHWFYRLNQKRRLKNILLNDLSTGCSMNNAPGIGDIKYVKDVQSDSIMTKNFKCSIFGPRARNSGGGARLNHCLRNSCNNSQGVPSGSFSYSAVSALTGMGRNSTAFFGCDNGKCCGCFGPKGGRKNYCGSGCTAINGGTIMRKAFAWFWVRNRMPETVLEKCSSTIQTLQAKIQTQGNIIKRLEKEILKTQIYPSCSFLREKIPTADSGMYRISSLKGISHTVFCDMTSKNGIGVTVIGHDSESRTLVDGYETPGSYRRKITYNIPVQQIVSIINESKRCEQSIKYACYDSAIVFNGVRLSWWVSREGSKMNYWGGAAVDSGKCACGMTNSCAGGFKCNCDMNDQKWREDSGYLTDKNTLPVTELRFGDTDYRTGTNIDEFGHYTLGKLRCWG